MNLIYHYTYADNFKSILDDNKLLASQMEFDIPYISFTRSSKFNETSEFAGHFGGYFVVDKDKLKSNYSIQPYNFFYNSYIYDKNTYIENIQDTYPIRNKSGTTEIDMEVDEQEERLRFKNDKTCIDNFKKYVLEIVLFKDTVPKEFNINAISIEGIKRYIENKYDIPVKII